MSSREIRDLSQEMQVLWNKLHDRVRRDVECQKRGLSILLTCTHRSEEECDKLGLRGKQKIARKPSEAFEFLAFCHGRLFAACPQQIIEHARALGLKEVDGSWERSN